MQSMLCKDLGLHTEEHKQHVAALLFCFHQAMLAGFPWRSGKEALAGVQSLCPGPTPNQEASECHPMKGCKHRPAEEDPGHLCLRPGACCRGTAPAHAFPDGLTFTLASGTFMLLESTSLCGERHKGQQPSYEKCVRGWTWCAFLSVFVSLLNSSRTLS